MSSHYYWKSLDGIGLEHLTLHKLEEGVLVDSWVIGQVEGDPFRLHYTVTCDSQWRTRSLTAAVLMPTLRHTEVVVNEEQVWTDGHNHSFEAIDGCVDLDISATPFTNTLPIRRLNLKAGEAAVIEVAYLSVPDLEWSLSMQRYTCLARAKRGARYLFESLRSDFKAEIEVDAQGLVVNYPGLYKSVSV